MIFCRLYLHSLPHTVHGVGSHLTVCKDALLSVRHAVISARRVVVQDGGVDEGSLQAQGSSFQLESDPLVASSRTLVGCCS
jgi:hypothetical protein